MILTPKLTGLAVKLGAVVVTGVLIAAAGAVLWQHYSGLVQAKTDLTAKATSLEASLTEEKARSKALTETISSWEKAATVQAEALTAFSQAQGRAAQATREIKHVLSQHDLGGLAAAKPALIEARINAGTSRAMRLLERASTVPASIDAGATAPATRTSSAEPAQP